MFGSVALVVHAQWHYVPTFLRDYTASYVCVSWLTNTLLLQFHCSKKKKLKETQKADFIIKFNGLMN